MEVSEIIAAANEIFRKHNLYVVRVPDKWIIYRRIQGRTKGELVKKCKTAEDVLKFAQKQEPKQ